MVQDSKRNRKPVDVRPDRSPRHINQRSTDAASMSRYAAAGDPPLEVASYLTLQEPFSVEPHLVTQLMRRQINAKEAFTIRDGSGDYFRVSLKELSGNTGLALPYEQMARSPEPTVRITLACAVLGRQRMLFVMQKATELGVTHIVPLLTDHSVPTEDLEHEKASSWPGQILRAARQCRRGSLPHLDPPTSLDSFISTPSFSSADLRIVLDDRSDPPPMPTKSLQNIVLLVGPEGGFSDSERLKFEKTTHPWVLGGRVLRAETAVVVGLSAVHMRWGDFK